jgi:hypothetical protein
MRSCCPETVSIADDSDDDVQCAVKRVAELRVWQKVTGGLRELSRCGYDVLQIQRWVCLLLTSMVCLPLASRPVAGSERDSVSGNPGPPKLGRGDHRRFRYLVLSYP